MYEGTSKPGFTILELVIAVAITVLLVTAAVPRYNAYTVREEFRNSGQQFVTCLTQAKQAAADPQSVWGTAAASITVHYTRAVITQSATTASCYIEGLAKDRSVISTLSYTSTGKIWSTRELTITDVNPDMDLSDDPLVFTTPAEIFYSAARSGVPITFRHGGSDVIDAHTIPHDGFLVSMGVRSAKITGLTGELTMDRLGLPVQFKVEEQ